jgi:hypothetical protein
MQNKRKHIITLNATISCNKTTRKITTRAATEVFEIGGIDELKFEKINGIFQICCQTSWTELIKVALKHAVANETKVLASIETNVERVINRIGGLDIKSGKTGNDCFVTDVFEANKKNRTRSEKKKE